MEKPNPLGYELIVLRKIEADEITKTILLPKTLGWRLMPYSHNKVTGNYENCLRVTIKGHRTKNRLDGETTDA